MSNKVFFEYERMEPFKYPEPRDLRMQLEKQMVSKYSGKELSKISFSTEFVLKSIKPKSGGAEIILLKYRVINVDWEDTRELADIKFSKKMLKWVKNEEQDYADYGDGGC